MYFYNPKTLGHQTLFSVAWARAWERNNYSIAIPSQFVASQVESCGHWVGVVALASNDSFPPLFLLRSPLSSFSSLPPSAFSFFLPLLFLLLCFPPLPNSSSSLSPPHGTRRKGSCIFYWSMTDSMLEGEQRVI